MADTIRICSPEALGPADAAPLAPRLPTLRDRVLGIRIDPAWRSWRTAADELARVARQVLGVGTLRTIDVGARTERTAAATDAMLAFARTVDAAVVGLGT